MDESYISLSKINNLSGSSNSLRESVKKSDDDNGGELKGGNRTYSKPNKEVTDVKVANDELKCNEENLKLKEVGISELDSR